MDRHHADEARTAGAYRAQAKVHGASKQDPPPSFETGAYAPSSRPGRS